MIEKFEDDIADIFGLSNTIKAPPSLEPTKDDLDMAGTSITSTAQTPMVVNSKALAVLSKEERKLDSSTDYDFTRKTMHHNIEQGSKALTDLVYFATSSGGPEAYKQVASVMDAVTRASKQLLEIQKQMNELDTGRTPDTPKQTAQTINNNTIIEAPTESAYSGLTRDEAMAQRATERAERAKAKEKLVN